MKKRLTAARYLVPVIRTDLRRKMVFLSGPRQVGKTTLALDLLGGDERHPAYFNWDHPADQRRLLQLELPAGDRLIVLDEIHKYRRWRNWLKGLYDKTRSERQYLVTGSARLDLYRRGGDALTGRYHLLRLHPFSLPELVRRAAGGPADTETLLRYGGFPEPLAAQSERLLRRWHRERMHHVLRDDIMSLERVLEVAQLLQLTERLPALVGAPLSLNALREDLQVSHPTVQHWIEILERLFVCYRIAPYGAPRIRAVKKEQKAYLWDWTLVPDAGARFENLVMSHLLKYCHCLEDTEGYPMELRYLRDTDGREVDAVVLRDGRPLFGVECGLGKTSIPAAIHYYAERLPVPKWYVVHHSDRDFESPDRRIRVCPFHVFAQTAGLV